MGLNNRLCRIFDYSFDECVCESEPRRRWSREMDGHCFYCHFHGDQRKWKAWTKRRLALIMGFYFFQLVVILASWPLISKDTERSTAVGISALLVFVLVILPAGLIAFIMRRQYLLGKKALLYYPFKMPEV
ncbi:hypothetical protein M3Y99_01077900 [Aphelenchoides fujianensis]|nr:hypothetical protein M3Y99_01077900 [Aphelenchoides fujianensis]